MAISFFYRGGLPYESVMWMSGYERQIAKEWHDEYIEREMKIRPMSPNY